MAQRQLNIRSDEAAERASALARRLGRTTAQVVEDALRAYDESTASRDELGLTPAARRRFEAIREAVRELAPHVPRDMPSDHDWLYDEDGLPK